MKSHTMADCFLAMLLIALTGCGSSIKYTTAEPKPADIVGTYQLTSETASNLVAAGYFQTNASISFYADGKFEATNMPGCWLPMSEPLSGGSFDGRPIRRSYDSGAGTWKIADYGMRGQHSWGMLLNLLDTKGIESIKSDKEKEGLHAFGGPMLRNDKPPYLLHFVVSDPDGGESLEFFKAGNPKNETSN